jgi:hypothetical protein
LHFVPSGRIAATTSPALICCIEGAGADWDIWNADPTLVEAIQRCSELAEGDIEGLIEALTAQIRGGVYASRTEEWVVVSPNY